MTGFLKLLVLLCAVSKLSAQILDRAEEQENMERNLDVIFNSNKLGNEPLKPRPGCGIRNVPGLEWNANIDITNYESNFGEFPWTVAVLKSGNYSFVGTLIHPRVVLTAANRVENGETYTVRAGEWNIKSPDERLKPKEIEVQSVIKHPAFRMDNFQNDVALLILQQWFELDAHINVICLPDHGANPPRKSECYANGWGKDGFRDLGQSIAIMKRVPFHVVGFSECRDRILKDASDCRPEFCLSRSTLCAEGQISVDMCHGDGGGPLACPIGDRYQLSGVMSFGIKCNGIGSGYANVALVRNWIDQELTAIGLDISYYSAESSLLTI
ncbi:phenoloxidase-activating factor 2 [Drosophila erecta]|uniref:phenoloxidase-activating factor 2 n=1 Tax=Drosophila erecta TaxID=7220 RepID=UPI000F06B4F4|nr:phenoloxidase-activating factor 2 [Drosophila erecta]